MRRNEGLLDRGGGGKKIPISGSQDQAILDVYFEGEGKTRKFALKKIGADWKFDNLGHGLWP